MSFNRLVKAALNAAQNAQQNSSYTGAFNGDGIRVSSNVRRQTAVIYDVLSEGPIEGLVNGVWAKGDTTAKNERRYVLEMQQGKVNYKQDGINSIQYKILGEKKLTPWAKILDIKL